VQLSNYLSEAGPDKLNVIAIAWTEGRYGDASKPRLDRFIRSFHPSIRVVYADARVEKAFSPLVYVPANFMFNAKGKVVYGDGNRKHLDRHQIASLVNQAK